MSIERELGKIAFDALVKGTYIALFEDEPVRPYHRELNVGQHRNYDHYGEQQNRPVRTRRANPNTRYRDELSGQSVDYYDVQDDNFYENDEYEIEYVPVRRKKPMRRLNPGKYTN